MNTQYIRCTDIDVDKITNIFFPTSLLLIISLYKLCECYTLHNGAIWQYILSFLTCPLYILVKMNDIERRLTAEVSLSMCHAPHD